MSKTLLLLGIAMAFLCLSAGVWAQGNQTITSGTTTTPVSFPTGGCSYSWVNDNPAIGLPSSGTGNITSFTATNPSAAPITATITATPVVRPFDYIYVNNAGDRTISVVNATTGETLSTIPVGANSYNLTLSPDNSKVYVTNSTDNTITVISTATNAVIAKIPIHDPLNITFSADGTKMYVTSRADQSLLVIDLVSYAVLATVPLGFLGFYLAVSPDGSRIYVVGYNIVKVIDAATYLTVASIPVTASPSAILLSPDGSRLYVGDFYNSRQTISVINTASNMVIAYLPAGQITSFAISPDGKLLYVASSNRETILVISTATNMVVSTIPCDFLVSCISISPDGGNLFVGNEKLGQVSVVNTANDTVTATLPVGTGPTKMVNFVASCNSLPVTFSITVNPLPVAIRPAITASGNLSSLRTIYGSTSVVEYFDVSATNLSAGILVTPAAGFEISLDNISFFSSLTIPSAPAKVFIRLAATTAAGQYAGNIMLSSTGAADFSLPMPNSEVVPAPLTVKAGNITKTYGSVLASTLGSVSFIASGMQNSETVGSVSLSFGVGSAATAAAGTYAGSVAPSGAIGGNFLAGNYLISYLPGDLIVVHAALTIKADDQIQIYGTAGPALTVSYTGFVNGEGPGQMTVKPVVTTTATVSSPAGKYPITASRAASPNYSITYLPGTLTIKVPVLVVPNTFTPNGDGINDTWTIKDLDAFPSYSIEVFNRYGQSVFFTDSHPFYWDGHYNGGALPIGTYYYLLNLKSVSRVISGSVTIIR